MAHAKLHLICGNCGCNDAFEFSIEEDSIDNGDGTFNNDVYLHCRNCGTLHSLSDNAKEQQ